MTTTSLTELLLEIIRTLYVLMSSSRLLGACVKYQPSFQMTEDNASIILTLLRTQSICVVMKYVNKKKCLEMGIFHLNIFTQTQKKYKRQQI